MASADNKSNISNVVKSHFMQRCREYKQKGLRMEKRIDSFLETFAEGISNLDKEEPEILAEIEEFCSGPRSVDLRNELTKQVADARSDSFKMRTSLIKKLISNHHPSQSSLSKTSKTVTISSDEEEECQPLKYRPKQGQKRTAPSSILGAEPPSKKPKGPGKGRGFSHHRTVRFREVHGENYIFEFPHKSELFWVVRCRVCEKRDFKCSPIANPGGFGSHWKKWDHKSQQIDAQEVIDNHLVQGMTLNKLRTT